MPTATRLTAADLLAMPDEGKGYELVDGELRERTMSQTSSHTGGKIYRRIDEFAEDRGLGVVFPSDCGFQCFEDDPDRVRRPDVAFVHRDRIRRDEYDANGYCRIVPDLVVEVKSPHDANSDVHDKRIEWLNAGVRLVVLIDPGDETVHVYSPGSQTKHYNTVDALTLEPVLAGFSIPVASIFAPPPLAD